MTFSLARPSTIVEALRLLADDTEGPTAPLAGGTDLLLDLDDGRSTARRLVSLDKLPWKTLAWDGPRLNVGATLPLARLGSDATVRARLPGLSEGVDAVGSLALRHRATLGGNLGRAAPASDLLPILLAVDATVRLVGTAGRRELPVARFLRGSRQVDLAKDELIESVSIPEARLSTYVWQRVRPANDVSQVGVAVARSGSSASWRLALGGVLPVPTRIPEAEVHLTEERPRPEDVELAANAAATHARFVTDKRASEAYRRRLVATLVRRAVARAQIPPGER
ncbi:MAG: FAD binding domain-containing protein [Thermoplasmata archaeon]|nr:FAD binding domain-containing protein [Thermoplasmata archaeon]MCI4356387.1 FAD binding domain-containing protein [Thermoplasmata archaeon]